MAGKSTSSKATPAKTSSPTTNINAAMAAVQKQLKTTQQSIAQSLATQAQTSAAAAQQAQAAQAAAEAQAATLSSQNAAYQTQLAALQQGAVDTAAAKATTAQNAFDVFKARFEALGLGSLADSIVGIVKSPNPPMTSDGYYLALLQTPEYKARFGDTNAARIKNGLPALTESQILNNEQNYQKVMRQAGLPAGFYDQPSDFQKFMALDKSPAEVSSIVQSYLDLAKQQDPAVLSQLNSYYGLDVGHVAATLMDPTKAQPIINALTQNGTTAAAAGAAGIQDVRTASQMGNAMGAAGLDYAKQAQAYAQAQQTAGQAVPLEQRYAGLGVNYNLASGLQEALGGPEAVQAQYARQRLATAETSAFGGSAGADTRAQSLGIGSEQGVQ